MHWRQLKCQPPVHTGIFLHSPKEKAPSSKRPSKKRKSRCSAAEMLDFLKDYQQQRAEAENKKVRILQGMNEDKKNFGRVFLKS